MQGLSVLKTFQDLRQKLEREYARLLAHPTDADMAWNFFVTADHLPDYALHTQPKVLGGKSIKKFKRDNPLTHVCENLSNGAKHCIPHVIPKDKLNISVVKTGSEMTSFVEDGFVDDGFFAKELTLMVYLTPYEVAEFQKAWFQSIGAKIEVPWLATQVVGFWRTFT
jgi:hypothetical protein